jgi:hypothetical protein
MLRAISLFVIITVVISCEKENRQVLDLASETDTQLFMMATNTTTNFSWYKRSDSLLTKSSGSGHGQAFLRTRYNELASTQLDASFKVKPDAVFPEGSLVVKELIESDSILKLYAILYKQKLSPMADANGWVWGYIYSDGNVANTSGNKGAQCISCHSQTGQIDYMLMNKYFP